MRRSCSKVLILNNIRGLSDWIQWSDCSVTCGDGVRTRTRICETDCSIVTETSLLESETCNEAACTGQITEIIFLFKKITLNRNDNHIKSLA